MHRKLTVAVALVVTPLAFAAPALAQTAPSTLSFDHVVLDTPGTGDAQVVSPTTAPLTVTANLDPTTGDFTVDPSGFSAPTYTFTSPTPGSATIALASTASGTVDFSTGAVTLTGDFLATINLGSYGSCTIDTGPETLSTATTKPLAGVAFPAGATGLASGDGAFGVGWSTLPASTDGTACPLVNSVADGPGGIWISRGISPIATPTPGKAPKLALTVAKPAGVKVGKTATIKVTLANKGGADTKSVKVCVTDKKPLSPTSTCMTVKDPAAGSKHTLSVKLKTTKATAGSYKVTAKATGLAAKTVTLKLTAAKKS